MRLHLGKPMMKIDFKSILMKRFSTLANLIIGMSVLLTVILLNISHVSTQESESINLQGISFDATREHLIVATFEYLDFDESTGGLEIWRANPEPNLGLQYAE